MEKKLKKISKKVNFYLNNYLHNIAILFIKNVFMSKKVKIICDEIEYNLQMEEDKTILELALENDIDAPYSCQGGICSTCLAKLESGSIEMDNNQILTDDEIQDGYILSCQSRPTSDEVTINYDQV